MIESQDSNSALEQKRTKRALEDVLRIRVERELAKFPDNVSQAERQHLAMDVIEKKVAPALSDFPDESAAIMNRLRSAQFVNDAALADTVVNEFTNFLGPRFSATEIEHRLRRFQEGNGRIRIHRMLQLEVENDTGIFHVPPTILPDPRVAGRLFREALHALAVRLDSDPELGRIRTITGGSWIVYEHADRITDMGFTVSELDEKKAGVARRYPETSS